MSTEPSLQVRRVLRTEPERLVVEVRRDGGAWEAVDGEHPLGLASPYRDEVDLERNRTPGAGDGTVVLPVTPLSFRDFMLYEKHAVDAARQMARRYLPRLYPVTAAYERVTRSVFPRFRPAPLWYRQPIYYFGNALTFVPSGTPVSAPSYADALDYELELGFVLSRPLLDATPAEAEAAIGAFVVVNDFSARNVQIAEMRSGFGPQKAKHFLSSMSSTATRAADILPRVDRLGASVRVNGKTVARTGTGGMRFSLGEALAHASRSERLLPGELFATGTLPGGSGLETGVRLCPGDRLELEIDSVGVIEHLVVKEA